MKKMLISALILMLSCFCLAEVEYAMQGDVRVYVEDGLAGIEDAWGNPLCEAKYTYIEAFLDRDYAVCHIGEAAGVLSRSGQEIVPCKWQLIEFTSDGRIAVGYDYKDNKTVRHVYDLETGEVVYVQKDNEHVSVEGDRINIYSFHKKDYDRPPMHTDIFDSRMNLIFSADARLVDFGGVYYAQFNDGTCGALDMDGNVLLENAASVSVAGDGTISYHREQYRHRNVFEACVDIVGNALDRALWKNGGDYRDRNCVEWVLYRMNIVTQPREVLVTRGVLMEGEDVFEYAGQAGKVSFIGYSDTVKSAGEDLYLVYVGGGEFKAGWIYVDKTGAQVVPGVYDRAHKFIDGTAVVYDYNKGYCLIGKDGEKIGDVSWPTSWIDDDAFEQSVIPVWIVSEAGKGEFLSDDTVQTDEDRPDAEDKGGNYYRMMDRKGNFIGDTRYTSVEWDDVQEYLFAQSQDGNCVVLNGDGTTAIEGAWDGRYVHVGENVSNPWVRIDGLVYQIDVATGKPTHQQGYSDVDYQKACLSDGKTKVVIDAMGNPVGPYPENEPTYWP